MLLNATPPTTLLEIADGPEGTRQTLRIMRQLVRAGKVSPLIRTTAVDIVGGLRQKDWLGQVKAIHEFVRDRIRYVRDIRGVETLHTPERVLEQRAGDCDDKSVLASALLESLSHPTRLTAIGFKPQKFSHVYPETKIGEKWVTVETTEPVKLGWEPRNIVSKMVIYN
jgi:transglutaminase-like putative cysteine protease